MQRRHVLSLGMVGALAAPALIHAQNPKRVIVVGAGAAGLIAARDLRRAGAAVHLLEAAPRWGGRVAKVTELADFPIDSGAEWIHGPPTLLEQIFEMPLPAMGIETIDYRPRTYQHWHQGRLRTLDAARIDYAEVKFLNSTWYDALDRFIVQSLGGSLHLNAEVREISYGAAGVVARLHDGRAVEGDMALVTVPLSVLQNKGIRFDPPLPQAVNPGLNNITFGGGYKVFLRFSARFYPDLLISGPLAAFIADSWTESTFYDAAFGKASRDHVLGLFSASEAPLPRAKLSDAALIREVLRDLDRIYDGAASGLFLQGHAQNWSKTPFINGSYSMENAGKTPIATLLAPQMGRLFFAGEALGGRDQSTVQGAAFSAQKAVRQMLA